MHGIDMHAGSHIQQLYRQVSHYVRGYSVSYNTNSTPNRAVNYMQAGLYLSTEDIIYAPLLGLVNLHDINLPLPPRILE